MAARVGMFDNPTLLCPSFQSANHEMNPVSEASQVVVRALPFGR